MILTPIDFYGILYDITRSWPRVFADGQEYKHLKPQTFAVAKDLADIVNSDNLGKDSRYIGKKLFYSQLWENAGYNATGIKYEYPLAVIHSATESYPEGNKALIAKYSFVLRDKYEQQQTTQSQGEGAQRTFEEVEQSLRDIWGVYRATMEDYIWADIFTGAVVTASGWYSKTYLNSLVSSGDITRYHAQYMLKNMIGDIEALCEIDGVAGKTISYILFFTVKHNICGLYEPLPIPNLPAGVQIPKAC